MHDPSQHDDAGQSRRTPDEFTERLAARGKGNVGVIDVRRAQQQYDSLMDWAAGHFTVLGMLNARYGTVNTRAAGSGNPLPIVSGHFARKEADAYSSVEPSYATDGDTHPRGDGPRKPSGDARSPETNAAVSNVSATTARATTTEPATVARVAPAVRPSAATPAKGNTPAVDASTAAKLSSPVSEPSRKESDRGAAPETVSQVVKEQPPTQRPESPASTMTLTKTAMTSAETRDAVNVRRRPSSTATDVLQSSALKASEPDAPRQSAANEYNVTAVGEHDATAVDAHSPQTVDAHSTSAADARSSSEEDAPTTPTSADALRSHEVVRLVEARPDTSVRTSLLLRQRRSHEAAVGDETQSIEPRVDLYQRGNKSSDADEKRGTESSKVTPHKTPNPTPNKTPDLTPKVGAKTDTSPRLNTVASEIRTEGETLKLTLASEPGRDAGIETSRSPETERQHPQPSSSALASESSLRSSPKQRHLQTSWAESPPPSREEGSTRSRLPLLVGQSDSRRAKQVVQRIPEAAVATTSISASVETQPSRAEADSFDAQGASAPVGTSVATPEQTRTRLSAPEVLRSPLRLASAQMVWRKSLGVTSAAGTHAAYSTYSPKPGVASPPLLMAGGSPAMLYRAEAPAAFSLQAETTAAAAPTAPAQTGADAIDLEQITEHVSRVILRRIAVERERRGGGRWL